MRDRSWKPSGTRPPPRWKTLGVVPDRPAASAAQASGDGPHAQTFGDRQGGGPVGVVAVESGPQFEAASDPRIRPHALSHVQGGGEMRAGGGVVAESVARGGQLEVDGAEHGTARSVAGEK